MVGYGPVRLGEVWWGAAGLFIIILYFWVRLGKVWQDQVWHGAVR